MSRLSTLDHSGRLAASTSSFQTMSGEAPVVTVTSYLCMVEGSCEGM
ncbi:hypothetical protein ACFYYR_14085 [Streptomyces sp. NPDC001922]